jgi:hypothetical protein
MVKHIVFFKLTSFGNNAEKDYQLNVIEKAFSSVPEKLDYIVEYRTCRNIADAGHAWDFVIDSIFGSVDDLKRYQASDQHMEAVNKADSIKKIKAVIDYEY